MKQMYWKTMRFQLMKLLPGLLAAALAGILLIPATLWAGAVQSGAGKGAIVLLWAVISWVIYYFAVHYYGYLFQTAYVAAAAEYAVNQVLPSNYKDFTEQFVKGQFPTSAKYQYLHRLVADSMKELHKGSLWKDWILLGYLSVCCVCINFYKKKAGCYKSIADAVVLYAKNQQKLLADGLKVGGITVGITAAATLLFWLVFGWIPSVGWFAALTLGALTAGALKYAFLDSWFLARELQVFGQMDQLAASDGYEELSHASRSFRKLYHKVRREQSSLDAKDRPVEFDFHSLKFCGECGALVAEKQKGEDLHENVAKQDSQEQPAQVAEVGEGHEEAPAEAAENEGMETLLQSVKGFEASAGMEGAAERRHAEALSGDGEESSGDLPQDGTRHPDDGKNSGQDQQTAGEAAQTGDQKVVFCGECGAAIFPGEDFCGECGTPAERQQEEKAPEKAPANKNLFCGECGTAIEPGDKFCGECGAPVE